MIRNNYLPSPSKFVVLLNNGSTHRLEDLKSYRTFKKLLRKPEQSKLNILGSFQYWAKFLVSYENIHVYDA